MIVESFNAYPGYTGWRINDNGRRYVGTCMPNGTLTQHSHVRSISAQNWDAYRAGESKKLAYRAVSERQLVSVGPQIEAALKAHITRTVIVAPVINLNGTSGAALVEEYREAVIQLSS